MATHRSSMPPQKPRSTTDFADTTVELLMQMSRACHFGKDRQELRDREWTALRCFSRVNKFSKTPSALASFLGATRATASQIVKSLIEKSCLVRTRSQRDQRSVTLGVTPEAEKLLARHDPANRVFAAVAALAPEDDDKLRSLLRQIVARIDWPRDRAEIGHCRVCLFFVRSKLSGSSSSRKRSDPTCRFHRAIIEPQEIDLLCASFERA